MSSMVTTCPHCQTTFRVNAEQLNARQGEVRCGHCLRIFNAFDSLAQEQIDTIIPDEFLLDVTPPFSETPQPVRRAAETEEIEITFYDALEGSEEVTVGTTEPGLPLTTETTIVIMPPAEEEPTPPIEAAAPLLPESNEPLAQDEIPELERHGEVDEFDDIMAQQPIDIDLAPPPSPDIPSVVIPEEHTTVAVSEEQSPQSATKSENTPASAPLKIEAENAPAFTSTYVHHPIPLRKRHTGRWVAANLALLLCLAGQATYEFRSQIAASYPDSKPYLQAACRQLGCSLPLPHDLSSLDITASELQALPQRPDIILLTMVLRNQSGLPQAWPMLEVTFTDGDDKAIARRQLKPADYLPQKKNLADGFSAHSETPLELYISTGTMQPTGYRLLLL